MVLAFIGVFRERETGAKEGVAGEAGGVAAGRARVGLGEEKSGGAGVGPPLSFRNGEEKSGTSGRESSGAGSLHGCVARSVTECGGSGVAFGRKICSGEGLGPKANRRGESGH